MGEKAEGMIMAMLTQGIQEFKGKSDAAITEIASGFSQNLASAIKNYTEFQTTYLSGYSSVTGGAQKAMSQLMESMDKHFAEFKKQLANMYSETVSKSTEAVSSGMKTFQTQCAEILKKYPTIPENIVKEVLDATTSSKDKLNSELERRYKEVVAKLDKNFQDVKKQLALPAFPTPSLPPLDVAQSVLDVSKEALQKAVITNLPNIIQASQTLFKK